MSYGIKLVAIEKKHSTELKKQEEIILKKLNQAFDKKIQLEIDKVNKNQSTALHEVVDEIRKEVSKSFHVVNREVKESTEALQARMRKQIDDLNNANEFAFNTLTEKFSKIENWKQEKTGKAEDTNAITKVEKNLSVKPFDILEDDFITDELADEIMTSLYDLHFSHEGNRSIKYYGQYPYNYSGTTHLPTEAPKFITELIQLVNERAYKDKGHKVNSCLVTVYDSGKEFLPMHSDDEECIAPDSSIYIIHTIHRRKKDNGN